jgi:putative metallopeptidase DUF4344
MDRREQKRTIAHRDPPGAPTFRLIEAGNMLFLTLHELSHTVMTEFTIPVLGRIEDAADSFAVTRLIGLRAYVITYR